MSSSTSPLSSSTSIPISLSSKPPSLFGSSVSSNSLAPKMQQGENPKQKPAAGNKKKSERQPKKSAFIMADMPSDNDTAGSSPANQQSKKKTFKFSGGDTESAITSITNAYEPDDLQHSEITYYGFDKENFKDDDETTEDEASIGDDSTYGDSLESVIGRRLFQLPCTHGLIDTFKAGVRSNILKKLRGMLNKEPTPEDVFEIADSIDLLKLLGASDPMLDDIGAKMAKGITLYEKGMEKVSRGQDLLRSALTDISSLE